MTHIQEDYEGTALEAWEIAHGIIRKVVNGCEYVILDNPAVFNAACAEDNRKHAREMMMRVSEEDFT